MTTKQNHRLSQLQMTRVLLEDGSYICSWNAGVAGRVGERRDYKGRLLEEYETVNIPMTPVQFPAPERKPLPGWVAVTCFCGLAVWVLVLCLVGGLVL